MRQLPDDLATLDAQDLARQREVRDDKIGPLLRRWPALSRLELRELRGMYAERLRIAKDLGRRRRLSRRARGSKTS
jgi:hypothetical protein